MTVGGSQANLKGSQNLNEDTLGGQLKAAISQYIALELTQNAGRDNRALNRYLPWLFHPPSTMQQGWAAGRSNDPPPPPAPVMFN